jgi:hypothetical protein
MVPAAITSADMMAMVIVIVRRPARMIAPASPAAGALASGPAANGVATASGRGREAAGRAAPGGQVPGMIEDGQAGRATADRSVPAETGIDEMTNVVVTVGQRPATDAAAAVSAAAGTRAIAVHATPTVRAGVAIGPHGGIATTPAEETETAARAAAGRHGGIAMTLWAVTATAVATASAAIGRLGGIATIPPGVIAAAAAIGRLGGIATIPPVATAAAVDATASGRRAAMPANAADTRRVAPRAARARTGAAMIVAEVGSIGAATDAEPMATAARATRPGAATAGATSPDRIPRVIDRIVDTTIGTALARPRDATEILRRGPRVQAMTAGARGTTLPIALAAPGRDATIVVPTAATMAVDATVQTAAGGTATATTDPAATAEDLATMTADPPEQAPTVGMAAQTTAVGRRAAVTSVATMRIAALGVTTETPEVAPAVATTIGRRAMARAPIAVVRTPATAEVASAVATTVDRRGMVGAPIAVVRTSATLAPPATAGMAMTGEGIPAQRAIGTQRIVRAEVSRADARATTGVVTIRPARGMFDPATHRTATSEKADGRTAGLTGVARSRRVTPEGKAAGRSGRLRSSVPRLWTIRSWPPHWIPRPVATSVASKRTSLRRSHGTSWRPVRSWTTTHRRHLPTPAMRDGGLPASLLSGRPRALPLTTRASGLRRWPSSARRGAWAADPVI